MSVIRPPVRSPVYSPVHGVTSYGWEGGFESFELDLTSSASIDAWNTKYTGSYTCASTMWVKDHLGVYNEIPINQYALYGARWDGSDFYNTDGSGDPLTNTIGMAFWPSTTNVVPALSYRDFTHANWTAANGSITAGVVTLIDGTSVSDKNTLTASGANCTLTHAVYTSASGVHSAGLFIKRKTGTGTINISVDGGTTQVDITTQVDSDSGWHLGQTTLPTVTDPQIQIELVTSGDAVYLDWAQMDDGNERVSVHPIEGGATLAGQEFYFANDSLINDAEGSVYVEAQLLPDDFGVSEPYIIAHSALSRILYGTIDSDLLKSRDGTTTINLANGLSEYSKMATYWQGSVFQISSNGASSVEKSYDGSWASSNINIGWSGGASSQFNGIISKLIFDQDAHDATYWEGETAP